MPTQESQPPLKRPPLGRRHASTPALSKRTVEVPSTPSTPPASTQYHPHKVTTPHRGPRQHVVGGQNRMGHSRNLSLGKNLNKLHKQTQSESGATSKPHRRSQSIAPLTESHTFRRVGSNVSLSRNTSHVSLKKNASNVSLKRIGSGADVGRHKRTVSIRRSRSSSQPGRTSQGNRSTNGAVHFHIGGEMEDDEEQDASWVEENSSQSPGISRDNSMAPTPAGEREPKDEQPVNMVQQLQRPQRVDSPRLGKTSSRPVSRSSSRAPSRPSSRPSSRPPSPIQDPPRVGQRSVSGQTASSGTSGMARSQESRTPDADIITARLLHRHPVHNAPPQMSAISATATATPGSPQPQSFGQTQSSTGSGTPGTAGDLVSRFLGAASQATPKESLVVTHARNPDEQDSASQGGTLDLHKRVKSLVDLPSQQGRPSSSTSSPAPRALGHRTVQSPSRTPSGSGSGSNLPYNQVHPSRTQQKLWLQRASSNVEPGALAPNGSAVGAGAAGGMGVGLSLDGRIESRLARQSEQTALEYRVVRRFRSPIADALVRLTALPSSDKRKPIPRRQTTVAHQVGAGARDRSGLSQSLRGDPAAVARNARLPRTLSARVVSATAGMGGGGSALKESQSAVADDESDHDSGPDENDRDHVEKLLRRMWDQVEYVCGES
ncbi:hypothetical protein L228DRAFT_240002 [Xylona heveae TC161]|uniref:Uncharacterized protein n=1 Tax=Xylona heveae (strain CBS 132557 / TC161) TaxID=1328760 RepID=A0A165FLM5_XYLHT|nr:hypothetical protein L228DRAFT_240002 [Xylona heveae TC161]KZF21123.1 hypothetical protein L228DRAFT_240002 [Xylona heveae TC161]